MPRTARLHAPGSVVHVISRFVNREFLLAGPRERRLYLSALLASLPHADWTLLGYALMSSHVHLVMLAGTARLAEWTIPLNTAAALRLNGRHDRLGPVFADLPHTVPLAASGAGRVLAYVHNNPVRAGVVADAASSAWTSHRALVGLDAAPSGLDSVAALRLAGFDSTAGGRRAFDAMVRARSGDRRDPLLVGETQSAARRSVRAAIALPIELSASTLEDIDGVARTELLLASPLRVEPRWDGPIERLLDAVCNHVGIERHDLLSRGRGTAVRHARRLVIVAGFVHLRRSRNEIAAALGIAGPSASEHLARASDVAAEARDVAAATRRDGGR